MSGISFVHPADALRRSRETLDAWKEGRASPRLELPEIAGSRFALSLGMDRILAFISRRALKRGYHRFAMRSALAGLWIAPGSSAANLAAGNAFLRIGDGDRALNHLHRAATVDNATRRAFWDLAKLLQQMERTSTSSDALRTYRNARIDALRGARGSTDPSVRRRAAIALAEALHESGASSEAIGIVEAVLKDTPDDVHALRAAAYNLIAQNRIDEGCAIYRRLVAAHGNHPAIQPLKVLEPLCRSEHAPQSRRADRTASWLIGIGGGIGDVLHVTPLIANISRRIGEPLDVLVLGDYPGIEFLVRNPQYVNRVWTLAPELLQWRYRTVFLTHSFGPMRFAFQAERTENARDWRRFRAAGLNQTLFNLEAARELFGIPYGKDDTARYFVGDLEYRPPREALIGFHAGSKAGRWLSKRWPHFAELATRLASRGIPVASFGTADEHVAGTTDRTGGTIEEMCRSMLDCSLFVSNDSGAMHIASGLGMPTLSLFAPTDALTHLPLGARTVALALEKDCSPCEVKDHTHFASGHCRCIGEISAQSAEQEIVRLLSVDGIPCETAA